MTATRRLLGVLGQYGLPTTLTTAGIMTRRTYYVMYPKELMADAAPERVAVTRALLAEGRLPIFQRMHIETEPRVVLYELPRAVVRLMPWVARHVHAWFKTLAPDGGCSSSLPGRNEDLPPSHLLWLASYLPDLADWADVERPEILSMSVEEAGAAMIAWERRVASETVAGPRPESPCVFEACGYRVLRLTTREALVYQGHEQQHCVATYAPKVARGETEIYAIVDASGAGVATVEIGAVPTSRRTFLQPREVRQIKGPRNSPARELAPGVREALRLWMVGEQILAPFEILEDR